MTYDILLGLVGLICTTMGWWLKDLWSAHKELRKELSAFKEEVPKVYVAKIDFKGDLDEIKQTLRDIFTELRAKADK